MGSNGQEPELHEVEALTAEGPARAKATVDRADEAEEDEAGRDEAVVDTVVDTAGEAAKAEEGEEALGEAEIIAWLEAELTEARAAADEYREQMQRTAADFQNARRRQERRLAESIERAGERVILRLLPALDDLDLAFQNVPESLQGDEAAWVEGFRQIQRKLFALLEEEEVTPIAPDGRFDPNCHEAISHEPSTEVESGHIIATLRTGYQHRERVLRPALVRVAQ